MGLLRFIEKNLPEHWEKAARKHRCKKELCERIYRAIPAYYKGNKLRDRDTARRAFNYIRTKFDYQLINAIDVSDAFNINFWYIINNEANQILDECK